jgi:hypothetical protein
MSMTSENKTPFSRMPNEAELKAIRLFTGKGPTRPGFATVWEYANETGCTHVAMSGHVIIVRRAGSHLAMALKDVSMLPWKALDNDGSSPPPAWDMVVRAPNCEGPNVKKRGINPAYFALVAEVEKVAGKRAAANYVPKPGEAKKTTAKIRRDLLLCFSTWQIGCDVLDGWYFSLEPCATIRWEGIIMPRRMGR